MKILFLAKKLINKVFGVDHPKVEIKRYDHENGNEHITEYFLDGVRHRDPSDGPAYEEFFEDGFLYIRAYYWNGVRHNPFGPSYEEFYREGGLRTRIFNTNDMLHRPISEGPAYEYFNRKGELCEAEYWENGIKIKDA